MTTLFSFIRRPFLETLQIPRTANSVRYPEVELGRFLLQFDRNQKIAVQENRYENWFLNVIN